MNRATLANTVSALAEERTRLSDAKRAAEAKRLKAKAESDRRWYLDQLEKRRETTWNQIAAHIQKRQPNEYDTAVSLLVDLHDLAVRKQQVSEFQSGLEK